LKGFQDTETLQCCRVTGFPEGFFEAHGEFWEKVLAHVALSRVERQTWQRLKGPKRRRVEWLLGRVAAKDAIRLLVQKTYGLTLCPADVEIVADERGRPVVQGTWLKKLGQPIVVSLAHTEGVAVAVAGHPGENTLTCSLGIDIERVSRQSHEFEGVALTPAEQARLATMGKRDVEAWPLRLWCAKEAVGKALGQGLAGGPLGVVAKEIDVNTGIMHMHLAGEMARLFPEINGQSIMAYTIRDGDFVVASVLSDGRGQ
jgi:phosphopantetheinyl transferase